MEALLNALTGPLGEAYFRKALLGGCLAAVVCSVVGCLVILRRMAFLGDALSHAMIAGVAGGYLFMKIIFHMEAHAPAMLLGSLLAALFTVASIGFVSRVSRLKEDTVIGIMYTGVFAAGVILVSVFRDYIHIDLMHFIMGDVLGVSDHDLWVAAIGGAVVLSVIILFFRQFQLTSFDPVMAASIGMPVVLIDYVLTACVSLVVVSAVSMVGVILVVGLLIAPAASAYLLSDRLDRMMLLAAGFGIAGVVGGLYLCVWLDSSGGGAVMLFSVFLFLVTLTFAPNYGILSRWMRLRRMAPQQLVEDILLAVKRAGDGPIAPALIASSLRGAAKDAGKALRFLVQEGFLHESSHRYSLSEAGKKEADRILRAHRLWETYLQHVGAPAGDIHSKAHDLEHFNDPDSIDYIDDLLGHPLTDPHGSVIPENALECRPGALCRVSTLREGRCVLIEKISPEIEGLGLKTGDRVKVGPRAADGREWSLISEDGRETRLDHQQADATRVRLLS
jgi:manganese/iron transport system permease protein/iron/zinc/copper transport system permease protein